MLAYGHSIEYFVKRHRLEPAARPVEPGDQFMWRATAIAGVALVIRLIHLWQIRKAPFFSVLMGDARGYDEWAQRIAGGDWIGHDVFYQAPLYPYFLGTLYAIGGRSLLAVRICQAFIGSLACVLLAMAGRRFFSRRVGVIAGLGLALYAPSIFFDGLVQKSGLDVFFICLSIWLISEIVDGRRGLTAWLGLGLAMGALSLTRENALVFIVVIVSWALVRGGEAARARVATAGVFLLGLSIVLLPVAVRNDAVGGGFFITTSQFGPNFYIGNNPRADGTYASLRFGRGSPEYERQDATELAEHALGRHLTPAEVSGFWTDRALAFITSQPGSWIRLLGRKVALLWNATEMLDTESQAIYADWSTPLRLAGSVGHFGVLVPLAVLGLWVAWRERAKLSVLLGMLAAYAASVVLFYVFARYRYPLVPFLVLLASVGLADVPRWFRANRGPRATAAVVTVAAAAVLANWPLLDVDLMRAITENNLGTAFQSAGQFDQAVDHYRRALAVRSDYVPAYNNLGTALRASGRVDEAVASYERALALAPDYPDVHYNLANVLLEQGKAGEAAGHFRIALRSIPGSNEVHNNLGIALAGEGKPDAAIAEFREALRLDPDSGKTHRNLGDALLARGTENEGLDHLSRAVQLDPNDASAHYDLGSALLGARRLPEAAEEFRRALTLTPNAIEAHNNLGIALAAQGLLDEAIDQFQQALRLRPEFDDAQRNLTLALQARRPRR